MEKNALQSSNVPALVFSCFVIVIVALEPIIAFFSAPPVPQSTPVAIKLPPTSEEVAKPHLSWADQECERVVEEYLRDIDMFFAASKKNTRPFAEEALSWGSKWRLATDYVPFTSGGRHEKFMREKFEEYVFKPSELEDAVKQVVARYVKHVDSIEGKMLVSIRTDVANFPSAFIIAKIDESELRKKYDEALKEAIEAVEIDIGTEVVIEVVVATITAGILTQIAVRLGVSGTILGGGASGAGATFGISLIVGLIVDQIVSWVWDWYADPRGELATMLDGKLDEINRLIVGGSDDVHGLRKRLREFATARASVRNKAVLAILQSQ